MRSFRRLLVVVAVSAALVGAPALGAVADAQPAAGARVKIADFKFKPNDLTVFQGQKVRWLNVGPSTHTVTSDDGTSFNSGAIVAGLQFQHLFNTVGDFPYHCSIHPTMHGTIHVIPPGT